MGHYLKSKPGSIEEVATRIHDDYQDMFKKELEKTGKSLGQMTADQKKAFFNKVDSKYNAKNEKVDNPHAIGMAQAMKSTGDKPPLKKSTITKAHDIADKIKKESTDGLIERAVKEITSAQKKLPLGLQKAIKDKEEKETKSEAYEGYGEQVIKAAKMYMKDQSCSYEMAAEKYGCSVSEVKKCCAEMQKNEEVVSEARDEKRDEDIINKMSEGKMLKASHFKPRQFVMYKGKKCQVVGSEDKGKGEMYTCKDSEGNMHTAKASELKMAETYGSMKSKLKETAQTSEVTPSEKDPTSDPIVKHMSIQTKIDKKKTETKKPADQIEVNPQINYSR